MGKLAMEGQKLYLVRYAFALPGRWLRNTSTQGDALGWGLFSLSGRLRVACESKINYLIIIMNTA